MEKILTVQKGIAGLQIAGLSDSELEAAFTAVVKEHRDSVKSIQASMIEADGTYGKYLEPGFVPDEALAKKDRADLNKAEKNIAEKYAELKAAYEKPLLRFEANVRSIRNAIKEASAFVDGAVKTYEEEQKGKKRKAIEVYFKNKRFDLVPLTRLFDERWLNKGYKMPDVEAELDRKIGEIYGNIKTLEQIPEYGMTVKALYLETLDIGTALRQVETLKDNAARLAREEIEREEREQREAIEKNRAELAADKAGETRRATVEAKAAQLAAQATGFERFEPKAAEIKKTAPLEFTMRVRCSLEALNALKKFMNDNGIVYGKL
jgi:hypothetical protein